MRGLMDRAFARFGTEAVLHTGSGEQKVQVFFESTNSKAKENMRTHYHPLGRLPKGQYICRFPASVAVAAGNWVHIGGADYLVCRVEEMRIADGCIYRWALCTGKGGADNWG